MAESDKSRGGQASTADESNGSPGKKQRSTRYPRYSLRDAESLAKAAFDLGAREVLQDAVAKNLNFSGVANGAYKGRRAAARYFNLVNYSGDDYITVTEPWISVFHEEDPARHRLARQEAVLEPDLYRQLCDVYRDRMLPQVERLARDLYLNSSYGIQKEAAEDAARAFRDSVEYAGLLDAKGYLRPVGWNVNVASGNAEEGSSTESDTPIVEPLADTNDGVEAGAGVSAGTSPLTRGGTTASGAGTVTVGGDQDLDRIEVRLRGGRKAYLLIPGALTAEDKKRLKGHIDLILDDEEVE